MNSIKLKGIIMEDFVQYKKPSMFLISSYCNWKCCTEANLPITVCQNEPIVKQPTIDISIETLYNKYITNNITAAVVIGGLEPFEQFQEIFNLIKYFREHNCHDDFVIYTGFNKNEIMDKITQLCIFDNIIVKFGRFIPNQNNRFDDILGITLISDNQYAEKIC